MELFTTEHAYTQDRDISSFAFWSRSLEERDETFAWLRANAPVSWHRPMDEQALSPAGHGEQGFWAVTRAADINHVSKEHHLFSSALGGVQVQPRGGTRTGGAVTLLNSDPPLHTAHRNAISAMFTPKGVAKIRPMIDERAEQIVSAVVGAGDFDFVDEVSKKLPMLTVADLVGVPESLVDDFTRAGNALSHAASHELPDGVDGVEYFLANFAVLREIGLDLVAHRRRHPADDVATAWAQGEVDGHPFSDDEIATAISLLASAGNDTTRHTTSWTMWNLWSNPDQKAWLAGDFEGRIGAATEEFVRHSSVVNFFARTATRDTELAGVEIAAGDKLALLYCSGNRDETLFPDPHRFDLQRPRANNVAFGGRGVHYCLGNVVAKAQLRAIFGQVLARLPHLEVRGEPVVLHHEQFNAVRHLWVTA